MRSFHRSEEAITLVESLIALFILSVGVLALASVSIASLASLRDSRNRQQAVTYASSLIEESRVADFGSLGNTDADVSPGDEYVSVQAAGPPPVLVFDHDEDTSTLPEPIIELPVGSVADHATVTPDGQFRTFTFVTWWDDPAVPGARNGKRVTTIVRWQFGDTQHEARESTIVAQAERGLPVPDFALTPKSQSRVAAASPAPAVICFGHELRNLGADDEYDVQLTSPSGTAMLADKIGPNDGIFTSNGNGGNKGWDMEVWQGPRSTTDQTLRWKDINDDGYPDAPDRLLSGQRIVLNFCFVRTGSDNAGAAQWKITVRSKFDPTVTAVVLDTTKLASFALELWLHDSGDVEPSNPFSEQQQFGMDDDPPVAPLPLPDYDDPVRDRDKCPPGPPYTACSLPGLTLPFQNPQTSPGTSATVAWVSTIATATPVTPSGTWDLRLYTSTNRRAKGAVVGVQEGQQFKVQLVHVTPGDPDATPPIPSIRTVISDPPSFQVTHGSSETGFKLINRTFTITTPKAFSNNDVLALEVRCVTPSTGDIGCILGYDVAPYASSIRISS